MKKTVDTGNYMSDMQMWWFVVRVEVTVTHDIEVLPLTLICFFGELTKLIGGSDSS